MDDDNRSLFTVVNGPEAVVELLRRSLAYCLFKRSVFRESLNRH